MKKNLVVSLTLTLMFSAALNVSAATHCTTGDFSNTFLRDTYDDIEMPKFEGWYSIDKNLPAVTVDGAMADSGNKLDAEYYLNDQTFGNVIYAARKDQDSETYLKGSYLWDNGWFSGMGLGSFSFRDKTALQLTLSPGYRYSFAKNGYLAASVDLTATDDFYDNAGLIDFEVDALYSTNQSRMYGQIILPNKSVWGNSTGYYHAGGAFKASKHIVWGVNYLNEKKSSIYDFGCSTTFKEYGFEARYRNGDNPAIDLNFLYSFAPQYRAGLEISKQENTSDPYLTAKLKYTVNKQNSLILIHEFANNSAPNIDTLTYLRWNMAL